MQLETIKEATIYSIASGDGLKDVETQRHRRHSCTA